MPPASPGIDRQGDRDGPEQAVRGAHVVADAAPVRLSHESVERRESADAEHHDITRLARRDRHRRKAAGPGTSRGQGFAPRASGAAGTHRRSGHAGGRDSPSKILLAAAARPRETCRAHSSTPSFGMNANRDEGR